MKYYYAVIFTSILRADQTGYDEMANYMEQLATSQPGFLGFESARSGIGISVSYWDSIESIQAWKAHTEHLKAQRMGRKLWYDSYHIRICRVEREYKFEDSSGV